MFSPAFPERTHREERAGELRHRVGQAPEEALARGRHVNPHRHRRVEPRPSRDDVKFPKIYVAARRARFNPAVAVGILFVLFLSFPFFSFEARAAGDPAGRVAAGHDHEADREAEVLVLRLRGFQF